ncbi:MAG TPA: hypothetical protein VJN96_03615 [Vicinamibacterales bacterium]|nr:hypothetical protein [Vicinamibacterales bacterium]
MFRRFPVLVSVIVTITALSAAEQVAWKQVTPTEARFSISMPGDAKESTSVRSTSTGLLQTRTISANDELARTYIVSWTEYRSNVLGRTSAAAIFDGSRDALLASKGARLLRESEVAIDGTPGRTIDFAEPDGRVTTVRFLVTATCFYQLMASNVADTRQDPGRDRFFASFQLTR